MGSLWEYKKAAIRKQTFYAKERVKVEEKVFKCILCHTSAPSMKIMLYELFRKFVSSFSRVFHLMLMENFFMNSKFFVLFY